MKSSDRPQEMSHFKRLGPTSGDILKCTNMPDRLRHCVLLQKFVLECRFVWLFGELRAAFRGGSVVICHLDEGPIQDT
jgi:hypothetical protein